MKIDLTPYQPETQVYMKNIIKQLKAKEFYDEVDAGMLTLLARNYNTALVARQQVGDNLCVTGRNGELVKHPLMGVINTAEKMVKDISAEFGLMTKSRAKIRVTTGQTDEEDELTKFLKSNS